MPPTHATPARVAANGYQLAYDRDAIMLIVCEEMAHGINLNQICLIHRAKGEHFPTEGSIRLWGQLTEYATKYAQARIALAEHWADQIMTIADDSSEDTIIREKDGMQVEVQNTEWVNRSRLRVDSRKWLLSKALPKVYGDKLELSGNADAPLQVVYTRRATPTL